MNTNDSAKPTTNSAMPDESEETPKVVTTQDLFEGQREIAIEHAGERYRLRITRRGKLILQK